MILIHHSETGKSMFLLKKIIKKELKRFLDNEIAIIYQAEIRETELAIRNFRRERDQGNIKSMAVALIIARRPISMQGRAPDI